MSVVVSAVAPGFDVDVYEAVTSKAMPDGQLPDGCELHIAGPVDDGWRVITVWHSRDAFDRFRHEHLLPAFRELAGEQGGPPPEPEVHPVHKLITA